MSSVKVIDLNEEVKEEAPTIEEEPNEEQQQPEIINEVVEEVNEPIEIPKEENKEKPKPKAQPKASDIVKCDKCDKSMSYKIFRYSHNCDPKPVKKQANPKPKAKQQAKPKAVPKPPPEIYYSESDDDDDEPQKPLIKKKQPAQQAFNPTATLAQHYQFLQNQMMQQKQERYNNLCMNMFSSKSKKR